MSKVRAELELATNVKEIGRQLEQVLGQLSQARLLEVDLGPAIAQVRTLGSEVDKVAGRIEKAMRPLSTDRNSVINRALNQQKELRNEVIPKMMQSSRAEEMRKAGETELRILKAMVREFNQAVSMPDLDKQASKKFANVRQELLDLITDLRQATPNLAKNLVKPLDDARAEAKGLSKELDVLETHLKSVSSAGNRLTKTVDQAVREQQRIVDSVVSTTTKAAHEQSKALAQSTAQYRNQITSLTNAVKSDYRNYNESTVKNLLGDMRREFDDMRKLRDEMVRRGELNAAQASNFQRNLLSRQGLIESYELSTMPSLQKRALDQQFVNDRRMKQLDVWRKVGRAEDASTTLGRMPTTQNAGKLARQVSSLQKLAEDLSTQRQLFERGNKKMGISKDPAYAQMLQILETNVNSKINAYRNQYEAARVSAAKRGVNQVTSAIDPTNTIDFSNVAYARARNLRAQQARIEEVRNAIERSQKGRTAAGGLTGTLTSEIGTLDSLIAQGTSRLGHKNIGAAETEELSRTLNEMRRLREKYLNDLAGYTQRDVDLHKAADREAESSARKRLTEFKKLNQEARQDEARGYVQGLLANPSAVNKLSKNDVTYARAMVQQAHHMYRQGLPDVPDEHQMAGIRVALDDRMKQLRQASFSQRMMSAFGFNGGGAYGRENDSVMHHINKRVTNVSQMLGTSLYGMGVFGLGSAVAGGTIGQAAQKETLTNTLAGLINSYAKFTDVTGNAVNAQQNFQASLGYSGKVYDMLREKAVKSILTTQEMFDYFMSGAPQLMARGMNISQSINIVDAIASLGKAMGLSSTAVQSDVRDLAMGTVTVRSQVLRTMGMNSGDLRQARAGGPDMLAAYFEKIIAGVKPALDRLEDTTTSKLSKFMDTVQQIGIKFGEVMAPIVMPYLDKFEKSIMSWVTSGNAEKFAESFAGLIGTIFTGLDWFVRTAAPLVSSIDNIIYGGIIAILTKTAAQAMLASTDFKSAMASILPTVVDLAATARGTKGYNGLASSIATQGLVDAATGAVTWRSSAQIAGNNLATAFPTATSFGGKLKGFFGGLSGQVGAAIATSGFFGAIGNAIKAGFTGLGGMVATAGRGLLAIVTSTAGMIVIALTAAVASIMLLKRVVDNDRENVNFLENMNDNVDNALKGKGSTPEQIMEARKRAYMQSFDTNDPRNLKTFLNNPNASLSDLLNQASKETTDRMQQYGAAWDPASAQKPVKDAINQTLNSRIDTTELMGFVTSNLGRLYNRQFTDKEAVAFLGNNAGARKQLEAIRQQIVKDPNFAQKLATGNPIMGGMLDPEMQKRLTDTRRAADMNKLNAQLSALERASERAAQQISKLADTAEKGGVNLKAQAMANKANADVLAANTKFRIAERNALDVISSTAEGVSEADKLSAAGDLIQAQQEQAKTIESIKTAYEDQLRQLRENIIAQREENIARKEQVRISGIQVEADRRKMELSRLDYNRSGDLSGYLKAFNAAFNVDMRAGTASYNADIAKNRNERSSILRAGDSSQKVASFFNGISNPQFVVARMMQDSVINISKVYTDASGMIADATSKQISATGQAIDATNNLTSTMGDLNENVKTLTTTISNSAGSPFTPAPDSATITAQRASDVSKLRNVEAEIRSQITDRIKARTKYVDQYLPLRPGADPASAREMNPAYTAIVQSTDREVRAEYSGRIKLLQAKIAASNQASTQPRMNFDKFTTAYLMGAEGSNLVREGHGWSRYGITTVTRGHNYSKAELENMTPAQAKQIYFDQYWNKPVAKGLPSPGSVSDPTLAAVLMDTAINPVGGAPNFYGNISKIVNGSGTGAEKAKAIIAYRQTAYRYAVQSMKPKSMGGGGGGDNRLKKLSNFLGMAGFKASTPIPAILQQMNAGLNSPSAVVSSQNKINQMELQRNQMEMWMRVTERVSELNQKFNELVQTSGQLAGAFENSIEQVREAQRSAITAGLAATGTSGSFNMQLQAFQSAQQSYMTGNNAAYLDPRFAQMMGIQGGNKFGSLVFDPTTGTYKFNGEGSYQQRMAASGDMMAQGLVIKNALENGARNPAMLEMARRQMLFRQLDANPGMMPGVVSDYLSTSGKSLDQVIQMSRSGQADQMNAIPANVRQGIDQMFKPLTNDFLSNAMKSMLSLSGALSNSAQNTALEMSMAVDLLQTNATVFNERFAEVFQRMSARMGRDMDLIGLVGFDLTETRARNDIATRVEQLQFNIQRKQEGAFMVADKLGTFKPLDALAGSLGKIIGDGTLTPEQQRKKAGALTGDVGNIISQLPEEQRGALLDLWNQATADTDNLGTDLIGFFNVLREKFMDAIVKGVAEGDIDKLRVALREQKMLEVKQRQAAAVREAQATHEEIKMRNTFSRDQTQADQEFTNAVNAGSPMAALTGFTPMDDYNRRYEIARADVERGADEAVSAERLRLRSKKIFGVPLEEFVLKQNPNYYDQFRYSYTTKSMGKVRSQYRGDLATTRRRNTTSEVMTNFAQTVLSDPFAYISGQKNFGDELGNILGPVTSGHQSLIGDSMKGLFNLSYMSPDQLAQAYPQFIGENGKFNKGMAAQAFGYNLAGNFLGNIGGNMVGQAIFPGRDPASIGLGSTLGTAAGGMLAAAGTGIFGASGLMGLGAAAGPVGMVLGGVIGGLFGGLFGGSKPDPEEERQKQLQKQHQDRLEELLSRIDRSLRPMPDYFRTLRNDVLYGSASGWYSGRAYASLGRQVSVGGR
jgi:polyhydroxyalkanoate synthesis regulator phasin